MRACSYRVRVDDRHFATHTTLYGRYNGATSRTQSHRNLSAYWRNSRASGADYSQFLRNLFARLNAGRRQRLLEELGVMKELPERRMESYKRERVKVDAGSLICADRNVYSVPGRLIGEEVEARLYMELRELHLQTMLAGFRIRHDVAPRASQQAANAIALPLFTLSLR